MIRRIYMGSFNVRSIPNKFESKIQIAEEWDLKKRRNKKKTASVRVWCEQRKFKNHINNGAWC